MDVCEQCQMQQIGFYHNKIFNLWQYRTDTSVL